MQKKIILFFFVALSALTGFAQQIPLNSCGIVYTYDASGNRLKRVYFCNNGVDPYPARSKKEELTTTEEFQAVDALYPNPTSGKFSITFSKALKNAAILLSDVTGKTVMQFKASGHKINFDLSSLAAGVYYVKVDSAGNIITKKVVKQ